LINFDAAAISCQRTLHSSHILLFAVEQTFISASDSSPGKDLHNYDECNGIKNRHNICHSSAISPILSTILLLDELMKIAAHAVYYRKYFYQNSV